MDIAELEQHSLDSLRTLARDANIAGFSRLKKPDLIVRLLRDKAEKQGHELRGGVLEIIDEGIGFLRSDHYLPGTDDIYVSQTQIRRFNLRTGDMVIGQVRPPKDSEKYFGLLRAKRLVASNRHVVIMLDSITRLTRAYNLTVPPSGRTLTGGLDPSALYPPKHFFGAARNVEEGGSLTIVATCLVETGSRMDDVIYEAFKGTGNMERHLSPRMQVRVIFPAFDVEKSSTLREELLLGPNVLQRVWKMRRMVSQLMCDPPNGAGMDLIGATEVIVKRILENDKNE